jgi:hypothetical protein
MPAQAENAVDWQGYRIHFTTFPATVIPADVALQHNIIRGDNRIITNIAVRRDGKPVRVRIKGTARNLLAQKFDLGFREILEQDAIYYLCSQIISETDTIWFDIMIKPEGEAQTYRLEFTREYY